MRFSIPRTQTSYAPGCRLDGATRASSDGRSNDVQPLNLRLPTGFRVMFESLTHMPKYITLAGATAPEVNTRIFGEDVLIVEHLFLDVSVHLDALQEFHVQVWAPGEAREPIEDRVAETLGEGLMLFEET